MKGSQKRLLQAIFSNPIKATLVWSEIEALLISLGCEVQEGKGSAIKIYHGDNYLFLHRPHPQKEAKCYQIREVRDFLKDLNMTP